MLQVKFLKESKSENWELLEIQTIRNIDKYRLRNINKTTIPGFHNFFSGTFAYFLPNERSKLKKKFRIAQK